jgi:hypothetical protein
MKVSVVIPCYSDPAIENKAGEELWYTVCAAHSALEFSGMDFEIIPVMNGVYPMPANCQHVGERIKTIYCGTGVESPQAARDAGMRHAEGEFVFFLDAHVVVPPNFFTVILEDMVKNDADFMGTPHRFLGPTYYGAKVAWHEYLWCRDIIRVPPRGAEPWRAAVHPHGAFCMRRSAWERAGGYWKALKGWGGEETQLCLKLWMMGLSVWVTPRTYHWHWLPPAARRTADIFSQPHFARNFLLIAAAYGDEARVRKSYESLSMLYWGLQNKYPEMIAEVLDSSAVKREKAVVQAGAFKNIDELRGYFRSEGIVD